MLNRLSPITRRILALLVLLGMLVAVGSVTLLPVLKRSAEYDESIDSLEFRLQRYLRLAAQENPLKSKLTQLRSQRSTGEGLLDGESEAIAAANLQSQFKQWVQDAGGRLESTQILPGEASGVLDQIGIRAQFSGDIEALQQVLHSIEYGKTILVVDKIEVRAKRSRRRSRRPNQTNQGLLRVSLEISGYRARQG